MLNPLQTQQNIAGVQPYPVPQNGPQTPPASGASPYLAAPAAENREKGQDKGLRTFQAVKVLLSSTLSAFTMSSITHNKYWRVLPIQLASNITEAITVEAIYKGKIPFVNVLIAKAYNLQHPNQPPKQFKDLSSKDKEHFLPYIASFVTASSSLIQVIIHMTQGKMEDKTSKPVSMQTLSQEFRNFGKNVRLQPRQSMKHASTFAEVLGAYTRGLAPFRFLNRNPALVFILPVMWAAFSGFLEGKAAVGLANKTRKEPNKAV